MIVYRKVTTRKIKLQIDAFEGVCFSLSLPLFHTKQNIKNNNNNNEHFTTEPIGTLCV